MASKATIVLATIITVFISIMTAGVVYAALTERLDIKGSAVFVPETWKVNFKASSLSNAILADGAAEITAPTLSDTIIQNWKVRLTRFGSSASYTLDIENTGSLDAILTTFAKGTPTCTGTNEITKDEDEAIVCSDNLIYSIKYVSGDLATNGLTAGNDVAVNDMLKKNTTVKIEIKLYFSSLADELPYETVNIDGLDAYLVYNSQ